MTPLERAAKALHESRQPLRYIRDPLNPTVPPVAKAMGDAVAWEELTPDQRSQVIEEVRTVLTAVREPSEAMAEAGSGADLTESGYDLSYVVYLAEDGATECWQGMIDAALAEGANDAATTIYNPGDITSDGSITGEIDHFGLQSFASNGVVWISESKQAEAQRHGWMPNGVKGDGLIQVERNP